MGYSSTDQIPTKETDSVLVYKYPERSYEYEEVAYVLDSNKVKSLLRSYYNTDRDYAKSTSLRRLGDWIVDLRREGFKDSGSQKFNEKGKEGMFGLMKKGIMKRSFSLIGIVI